MTTEMSFYEPNLEVSIEGIGVVDEGDLVEGRHVTLADHHHALAVFVG